MAAGGAEPVSRVMLEAYRSDFLVFAAYPRTGTFRVLPAPLLGQQLVHGFGHFDRHGFIALYATTDGVVLHVRRRVHLLDAPPHVERKVSGREVEVKISQAGQVFLDRRYRSVADRWPYKGAGSLDAEEEEEEDYYLWLTNNLALPGFDSVRDHYAAGWS